MNKQWYYHRTSCEAVPLRGDECAGSLYDQMTKTPDNNDQGDTEVTDCSTQIRAHPRCKAAERVQQKILEWTECTCAP